MKLPSKNKYLAAVEDLKNLNNDVFLDDLKKEIEDFLEELHTTSENLEASFAEQSNKLIKSAQTLLKVSDQNQEKLNDLITQKLDDIKASNNNLLETGTTNLEESYEQLKQMIEASNSSNRNMEEEITKKYKELDSFLQTNTKEVERNTQMLMGATKASQNILLQNQEYTKTAEQHALNLQRKIDLSMRQKQELDEKWQEKLSAFLTELEAREKNLETTLILREEDLLQKMDDFQENFLKKQDDKILSLEKSNRLQLKLLIGAIGIAVVQVVVGVF